MPYVQDFSDVNLRYWYTNGGVWTLRDETLAQTTGGEDPNQITIPQKLVEDVPYHASVYLTVRKDTKAAGLTFNSQYPEITKKQHRVYLHQPGKDQLELVSGYTDETGSFVPQAQIPVTLNTTDFRLDVFVYENTYLVQLNGQRIIDKRPLFYHNGLLGFYTVGPANFDDFKLSAAEDRDPGNLVYSSDFDKDPGGAGWVPFSGDWRIANKQMTQMDPTAYAAGIGYESSTFQNYVMQVNFQHLKNAGAGVLFNMPSPYEINGAQIVRYSDEADAMIWGFFDEKGIFNRQGFLAVPPPGADPHVLKIYSGESSYDVYLDDELIARDVALQTPRGAVGLFTSQASAAYTTVEVFPLFGSNQATPQLLTPVATQANQKTANPLAPAATQPVTTTRPLKPGATAAKGTAVPAPSGTNPAQRPPATGKPSTPVSSNTASFQADFTGDIAKSGWRILNGDWSFSGGNLVQSNATRTDQSIVYTPQTFKDFSLEAGLTHLQGYGAGVLFNMPYNDRLNGAYLVRYSDRRPGAIFWGHYDDKGTFIGEGYANVTPASTDRHLLHIVSAENSYDIYLDGNAIIKKLPMTQNSGYIGLLTSNTEAAFDAVSVQGSSATPGSAATSDGFSDAKILSGKWDTNGNNITQQVTDLGDYILNSGVFAQAYTIETKISMPGGGDTGGGFIFHMPDRGTRKGAYMVRLVGGGKSIFWGYFDDSGKFQGQSSTTLTPAASYLLKMVVNGDRMDVFVNDQPVFQNVKLNRNEGWLGLISHGGVVKFEQIKATITGIGGTP